MYVGSGSSQRHPQGQVFPRGPSGQLSLLTTFTVTMGQPFGLGLLFHAKL